MRGIVEAAIPGVQTWTDDVGLEVGRYEGYPVGANRQSWPRHISQRNSTLEEAMVQNLFWRRRPSILEAQQSNNMRAEGRRFRKNF